VLDSIGSNTRTDTRGSELMRVLPRPDEDVNQQRISDKTRFPYDGSKNQRLNYPMIRVSAKQSGPVKPKGHDESINQS
jgi:NADH dehydrogenase/NADH:ubiquinone oxidoreductase subunit G